MSEVLYHYKNGNTDVTIYDDGTKVREWPDGEESIVEYPESIDLKVTQYCDLGIDGAQKCNFCHEQSNKQGQHGDLDLVSKIWSTQKPGTEVAIGGGNPLAHPTLEKFLLDLKGFGMIPNVTVNMIHMRKFGPTIRAFQKNKLIYGLGISYRGEDSMKYLSDYIDYKNVVFHMIMGIHDLNDCKIVIDWCKERYVLPKILLLGYKTFGNGVAYYSPEVQKGLDLWKQVYLKALINGDHNVVVSFDNLAIAQLDLENQIEPDVWKTLFQGQDSTHTAYLDAVKQEVAGTSTSSVRYKYDGSEDIRELFGKVRL